MPMRCSKKEPSPPWPCLDVEIVGALNVEANKVEPYCKPHLEERLAQLEHRFPRKYESQIGDDLPEQWILEGVLIQQLRDQLGPTIIGVFYFRSA